MNTLLDIQSFLALHRIAVVGVSRNPKDFTRVLFRDLLQRGYDAVPVNPAVEDVEGLRCYARVADIPAPVDGALLVTKPEVTDQVVRECAEAGIRSIWMHRGGGHGAVSKGASSFCAVVGIKVVEGECPYMFLPQAQWIHRAHGFCRKLLMRL